MITTEFGLPIVDRTLFREATRGSEKSIRQLIGFRGANVHAQDQRDGVTLVHVSAASGHQGPSCCARRKPCELPLTL